tara:strand:+ start:2005 stop:2355 length:351 start_codon:yes stop_codon:yes gene_type:complete
MNTSSIFALLPIDIKEEVVEHIFEEDVYRNHEKTILDFMEKAKRTMVERFIGDYIVGDIGLCDSMEDLIEFNEYWNGSESINPSHILNVSRISSREWLDSLPDLGHFLSDDSDNES